MAAFTAFSRDNDPYGEHDCAILTVDGVKIMFKIDYFDCSLPESTRLIRQTLRSRLA